MEFLSSLLDSLVEFSLFLGCTFDIVQGFSSVILSLSCLDLLFSFLSKFFSLLEVLEVVTHESIQSFVIPIWGIWLECLQLTFLIEHESLEIVELLISCLFLFVVSIFFSDSLTFRNEVLFFIDFSTLIFECFRDVLSGIRMFLDFTILILSILIRCLWIVTIHCSSFRSESLVSVLPLCLVIISCLEFFLQAIKLILSQLDLILKSLSDNFFSFFVKFIIVLIELVLECLDSYYGNLFLQDVDNLISKVVDKVVYHWFIIVLVHFLLNLLSLVPGLVQFLFGLSELGLGTNNSLNWWLSVWIGFLSPESSSDRVNKILSGFISLPI
jgi:hypothetical protein